MRGMMDGWVMGQDDELLFGVAVEHRGRLCVLPFRGAPNVLNNRGLVSLKALQILDRMHQPRVVQRVEQKEVEHLLE